MGIRSIMIRTGAALVLGAWTFPGLAWLDEEGPSGPGSPRVERLAEDMPGEELGSGIASPEPVGVAEPLAGLHRGPEAPAPGVRTLEIYVEQRGSLPSIALALPGLARRTTGIRVWMSSGEDRVEIADHHLMMGELFFRAPAHQGPVRFHVEINGREWGHADYVYPSTAPLPRPSLLSYFGVPD